MVLFIIHLKHKKTHLNVELIKHGQIQVKTQQQKLKFTKM